MESIRINKENGVPLTRQIYQAIVCLMLDGRLPQGEALPSTRELAQHLGVSRNTVTESYEMLRTEGYITGKKARVFRVVSDFSMPRRQAPALTVISGPPESDHKIRFDFSLGVPDISNFRPGIWRRMQHVALEAVKPRDLLARIPQGHVTLRHEIASWLLRRRGIEVDPASIFITAGTLQGLNIAVSLLQGNNSMFLLENPGFFGIRDIMHIRNARFEAIDVDEYGMKIEQIASFPARSISATYVTPSHQFPLGVTLTAERRHELLRLAESRDFFIFEDDYDSEYRHGAPSVTPMYSLNPERVFYFGTFSKGLFPGFRIGFALLPRQFHKRWLHLRYSLDEQNPVLEQLALAEFLRTRRMDRHIKATGKIYAQKLAAIKESIIRAFPAETVILGDNAGMHLAVKISGQRFDAKFQEFCESQGVVITPCCLYALTENIAMDILLLGYGAIPLIDIPAGIQKLGQLISASPFR